MRAFVICTCLPSIISADSLCWWSAEELPSLFPLPLLLIFPDNLDAWCFFYLLKYLLFNTTVQMGKILEILALFSWLFIAGCDKKIMFIYCAASGLEHAPIYKRSRWNYNYILYTARGAHE